MLLLQVEEGEYFARLRMEKETVFVYNINKTMTDNLIQALTVYQEIYAKGED